MALQITANLGMSTPLITTSTLPFTGTDDWTMGAMAYVSDPAIFHVVLQLGDDVDSGMVLYTLDTDIRVAFFTGGGQLDFAGLGTPPTATWTSYIFRRSSGTSQVYMNGATAGSSFNDTPTTPAGGVFGTQVGASGADHRSAEHFLYDRVLTTAEIALIGAGYCPLRVSQENLIIHWHAYSDGTDSVGTNTGTLGGSTVEVTHPTTVLPQHWAGGFRKR